MQLLHIVAICMVGLRLANGALDCAGRSDGNYADPMGPCSQIWYKCAAGVSSIQFCPDGLAYVDSNGGSCVDPNTLAACANPVEGAPVFSCASQNGDGDWANNASVCNQVSGYSCRMGVKSVRFCWATSRFDPLSQRCLFPKHMKACGGLELILPSDLLPPTPAPKDIQFDCLKKVGNFPDPEKPCSNHYVICRPDGFPSTGVCPANTVFDIDNNWCQYPQFVLACGGRPTTMPPMTTAGPTTASDATTIPLPGTGSPVDMTLSCDGLDIGYYPHPKQPCSSTFFACTGLKWAIPEPCAAGTFFDRVLVLCTYRDQIPECGGVRPNNTAVVPGQVAPDTGFNCSGLKVGNYPDTKPCSRFFFSCTAAGLASKQLCQINTFYDKDLDQCLFYADVPACSGTPRPITTATTPLPGGPNPTTPKPFDCAGKDDRNYAAAEPCADFFWECAHGTTYKQPCPGGLKYDVYTDACQRETDVIGCPKYIPRSTFCASKPIDGAYAYPGQCGTFVMCIKGQESVLTCPSGGVFDARTNQCKQAKDVPAPCGTGSNPSPLTCLNQTPGAHWNEKDCGVYITCTDNAATLSRCEEGRAFNPTTSSCVPMNQVPQCFPAAQDGLKFCQDLPDGMYAFPGNCRRAMFCMAKKAYVFYCWDNANPAWDSVAHKCVPATSTCTANIGL